MCVKKLLRGSLVGLVLLVLVLSPLAAWPLPSGNGEIEIKNLTGPTYPDQRLLVSELQEQIQLSKDSVKAKDKLIAEQKAMLDNLSSNLDSWGTKFNGAKATAESLLGEIGKLKEISVTKDVAYDALKADYDALAVDYQAKVDESNTYFQQATKAVAINNARPKENKWSTTLGAGAVFGKGAIGVDAMLGVGYGPVTIFGGATYMLDGNPMDFLKMDSYSYKAGLLFTF